MPKSAFKFRAKMTIAKVIIGMILLTARFPICASRMPRQDWSTVDLDEVDRQWSADDADSQDFISKDEELYQEGNRRREEAMKNINELMESNPKGRGPGSVDFERLATEAQNAGKPAMIFAKLHPRIHIETHILRSLYTARRVSDSGEWDWETMAALCDDWEDRLFFAMLEISCFPMTDEPSILVTVKRGWDGEKVYQFLKEHQSQFVEELKWHDRVEKTHS